MSPKNAEPIYPIVKEIIVLQQSGSLNFLQFVKKEE